MHDAFLSQNLLTVRFICIFLVFLYFAFLYLYWISSSSHPKPEVQAHAFGASTSLSYKTRALYIHLRHLVVHFVDLLLEELERGEENRVDHA